MQLTRCLSQCSETLFLGTTMGGGRPPDKLARSLQEPGLEEYIDRRTNFLTFELEWNHVAFYGPATASSRKALGQRKSSLESAHTKVT
jgi:hypothetical protein